MTTDNKPAVLVDGVRIPLEVGQVWEMRGGTRAVVRSLNGEPPACVICEWQDNGGHVHFRTFDPDGTLLGLGFEDERDLARLISPAPQPAPEPEPRETTRVWIYLYDDPQDGILAYADGIPQRPSEHEVARIVLDVPHGVGLGPDGPMVVKVGGGDE